MKVLVTGATGFIGHAVAAALNKAGHDVIATTRDPAAKVEGATVHAVAPLGPETKWADALVGVDVVIHLAARVHIMDDTAADPLADNLRANTEGTAKLAADAAAAGVRRFIFLSTIKVNGETSVDGPFTADDPPRPAPDDAYAIAKMKAEQALARIARETGMESVIIRLPLVYGPGVKGNFLALLELCAKRPWLPLGAIRNRRSLIYVGNLAAAVICVLAHENAPGRTFLVSDGDPVSTPELVRLISRALGHKARLLPIPVFLLRLAARLVGRSPVAARLTGSLAVDDGPIRRDLGWTPPFSMVQGLQETADWFRGRRLT